MSAHRFNQRRRADPTRGLTGPAIRRVVALSVVILCVSVGLSFSIVGFYAIERDEALGLFALGVIFLASEKLIFHVEARTEAVSYSPSDVALALGLVFFSPVGLVIARIIGASLGQVFFRRTNPLKAAFNLANFTLETVVAYALFRSVTSSFDQHSMMTWIALVSSLFLALLLGGVVVAAAISSFEGGLKQRLLTEISNSPIFHLPGAAVAAALAIATCVAPYLGVVVASLVPVVWLTVRSHGKLLHRYSDLIGAHEFSREVGDASDLHHVLSTAAEQIASNMRSELVAIRVWDRDGTRTEDFFGGRGLAAELPSNLDALNSTEFLNLSSETSDRDGLKFTKLRVSLADEQGTIGCVAVADRLGVNTSFDLDDLRRLTAMTQQLTVAVRKGQLHAQIQYEASHDRLTGLTNRGFFEAWVNERLATASGSGCVLFIDLDRFKEINDAFGHHAGDELLRSVATRIQLASPIDGLASRFGGDEFVVFAPNITVDQACDLAMRLDELLGAPFDLEQTLVTVAPSVGIVEFPTHGQVAATLLRRADIAMYQAKCSPHPHAVYSEELEENESARLKMLGDLRVAIAADELEVHFQPQIDARTGRVVGAEALARWTHPLHGPISPATFVELAEVAGLIDSLTDRVLAKALDAAAQWQRLGWDMNIAVNISPRSLLDQSLVQMVESHLAKTDLRASRLTLEITESTMMTDPDRTHAMLRKLTSLGITISIDDFGTGYSSLQTLGHLPVSEVKIDRSFIMAMATSEHDAIIVRSTIDLAHNLGLRAVAEGVEDADLLTELVHLNCDLAQGFGISRPLPLLHFNQWYLQRQLDHPLTSVDCEFEQTFRSPSVV